MKEYKINDDNQCIRIDKVIPKLDKNLSRSNIQKMIEEGNILVNGHVIKPSYKLELKDIIKILDIKPKEIDLVPQEIPLDIIYEDEDIILINKPKGMVVHPGARKSRRYFSECNNEKM